MRTLFLVSLIFLVGCGKCECNKSKLVPYKSELPPDWDGIVNFYNTSWKN
jgi:hypothetical protein